MLNSVPPSVQTPVQKHEPTQCQARVMTLGWPQEDPRPGHSVCPT